MKDKSRARARDSCSCSELTGTITSHEHDLLLRFPGKAPIRYI
jgi:hypothetical protein